MIILFAAATVIHHGWALGWFTHFFGISNPSGPFYAWWSGAGSDIGEYVVATAMLAGLGAYYHKHNCHEDRCRWIGAHTYMDMHGAPHPACRKHHPHIGTGHKIHFAELHRQKQASETT